MCSQSLGAFDRQPDITEGHLRNNPRGTGKSDELLYEAPKRCFAVASYRPTDEGTKSWTVNARDSDAYDGATMREKWGDGLGLGAREGCVSTIKEDWPRGRSKLHSVVRKSTRCTSVRFSLTFHD